MAAPKKAAAEIEFHPDGWERFERAAGVVAKSPPQHREKPAPKKKKAKLVKKVRK